MMISANPNVYRVLVIDDVHALHDDYRKVLCPASITSAAAAGVSDMESLLFSDDTKATHAVGHAFSDANAPTFELDSAFQGREGVEMLKTAIGEGRPYAMALVDMRMPPGWDGLQTIRELWKVDPNLQVVIVTAYSDYSPDEVSKGLAIDGRVLTLRKPFESVEVRQIVSTLCEKWRMRTRSEELERLVAARTEDLKRAAFTDTLTGLPNRAMFSDRLENAFKRSKREPGYKFAVLFIDADRFKLINDSLGHEAGDLLLMQMSERLMKCAREVDTITRGPTDANAASMTARLGGDEFTILLENIRNDADAARVAQRIEAIGAEAYRISGRTVHSSFSIGIATSSGGYEHAADMLRDADTAMYYAKREGRGRFSMFDQAMHNEAVARLTLEADLRTALLEKQVVLHYQPIVDMRTERLIGFEALARWNHPKRGWLPPADFIPLAEETGAIVPIGLQIFENACSQLHIWQKRWPELKDLTMSVNVSRVQLIAPDLVENIAAIMRSTGIEPRCIKVEITENAVMKDLNAAVVVLKRLRELGVQLHIDDFGTGYSSLSCLQSFPLTGLKIDREFVRDLTHNSEQASIIRTIITLAHALNLPLVAEGVETAEQTIALQSLGCDHAQGHLFAMPMDVTMAGQYIDRTRRKTPAAA